VEGRPWGKKITTVLRGGGTWQETTKGGSNITLTAPRAKGESLEGEEREGEKKQLKLGKGRRDEKEKRMGLG